MLKIIFIICLFTSFHIFAVENINKPIFKITKDAISKRIVANGVIFSPNSSAIRISRYGDSWENKIAWIAAEGTFVKKGETVLKLDTSNIEKNLDQAQDQLLNAELNLQVAQIKLKMDITSGESDIKIKQYDVEKAKLDIQKGDYVPLNDQKKTMIALNAALANLTQAKKNLEQTKISDTLQIRALQAPVQQYQANVSRYQNDINKMAIVAESDGYIIYNYIQSFNGPFQRPAAGVSAMPFSKIAEISNTSNLQAKLYVPEIDFNSIQEGIPVTLALLSNPTAEFTGKITNIIKIPSTATDRRGGEASSPSDLLPQNTVIVTLDKIPPETLPGMTVKSVILPPEKKGILKVPLFVISSEPKNSKMTHDTVSSHNETYIYTRKNGEKKWQWQKVVIGQTSYGFAEITSGLIEGDEVSEYE